MRAMHSSPTFDPRPPSRLLLSPLASWLHTHRIWAGEMWALTALPKTRRLRSTRRISTASSPRAFTSRDTVRIRSTAHFPVPRSPPPSLVPFPEWTRQCTLGEDAADAGAQKKSAHSRTPMPTTRPLSTPNADPIYRQTCTSTARPPEPACNPAGCRSTSTPGWDHRAMTTLASRRT